VRLSLGLALAGWLIGTGVSAAAAPAKPDAEGLLRRAFDNYRATTSQTQIAMTVHRAAWERRMQLTAQTRGTEDALVRFTAPAQEAGSATLKLRSETWLFNPKLNQVIKLPGSMLARSWMGSDFSYEDLSKSESVIDDFIHTLGPGRTEGGHGFWTVVCTPKPGAAVVWGRIDIDVRDDGVIAGETYFDQDLKPARRMSVDRIAPLGGRDYPVSMTMRPLDEPASWTRVETSSARFNIALPASVFTLSSLQNPRS